MNPFALAQLNPLVTAELWFDRHLREAEPPRQCIQACEAAIGEKCLLLSIKLDETS